MTADRFVQEALFTEADRPQPVPVRREVPDHLKPGLLSSGEWDWCAKTRNGERCQMSRHGDTRHSFDPPETLPAWLIAELAKADAA